MRPIEDDQMRIFCYVPQAFTELRKHFYSGGSPFYVSHLSDKNQFTFLSQDRYTIRILIQTQYQLCLARSARSSAYINLIYDIFLLDIFESE